MIRENRIARHVRAESRPVNSLDDATDVLLARTLPSKLP